MLITFTNNDFELDISDFNYTYQEDLTNRLDVLDCAFDQNIINEIVLWKLNRYVDMSAKSLELLNEISSSEEINKDLTKTVLKNLLKERGVQLPMASTILRFKNPEVYQIIDQRVYRIIYGSELKLKQLKTDLNIQENIDVYLKYLQDLKQIAKKLGIPYKLADRILYNADKRLNQSINLNNF